MKDFPVWVCEYEHDGATWTVSIPAPTFEDAQNRLRSIGWNGKVLGEKMLEVKIPRPFWKRA